MNIKIFKYRLMPTHAQQTALRHTLKACCWVYNKTLDVRRRAWRERQEFIGHYATVNMLPEWKKANPWLRQAYAQSLCEVCARVDLAFRDFFRRCKEGNKPGHPCFKDKASYRSFTFPQHGYRLLDDTHLYIAKIGNIKIKLHRPLEGNIKCLSLKQNPLGNWYAYFTAEIESAELPPRTQAVGIDLGCEKFAVLSTGEEIANPRFFRRDEKALAKAQRKLSQAEGNERKLRKRTVEHIHNRIRNRRTDFAHKLSRRLVNEFQVIVFEDLNIRGMQGKGWHGLNKSISDAAWGQLVALTAHKAENAGRAFLTVDPRGTSQMCSGCGEIVPKDLSERVHSCPHCDLVVDRDLNAARNILARGLASLPKG